MDDERRLQRLSIDRMLEQLQHPYTPQKLGQLLFQAAESGHWGTVISSPLSQSLEKYRSRVDVWETQCTTEGSDTLNISVGIVPNKPRSTVGHWSCRIRATQIDRDGEIVGIGDNHPPGSSKQAAFIYDQTSLEDLDSRSVLELSVDRGMPGCGNKYGKADEICKIISPYLKPKQHPYCVTIHFCLNGINGKANNIVRPCGITGITGLRFDYYRANRTIVHTTTDQEIINSLITNGFIPPYVDAKATAEQMLYQQLKTQTIEGRLLVPCEK